jgi:hypothetical protein
MEHLPMEEDKGFSREEFESLEAEQGAERERRLAAEIWITPEDVYFEFPASFPAGGGEAHKRTVQEIGPAQRNAEGLEKLTPQAAVLRYLENPNNRESSVFRYLTDWRIDPERRGEGVKLTFQHPPSSEDKKEIERIFRTFGWTGEEYEAKGQLN